jgi:hypothetical protein
MSTSENTAQEQDPSQNKQQAKEQFVAIKVSDAQAVLAYLDTRPHGEVRRLIDAVAGSKVVTIGE